ncbi:MAG TPA: glycosyltransferase 87 family protein [Mycobacteriales bacterium]|nr:glycosyltransferase 87 family protein [Mycobacteriales bacterium]
MSPAPVLPSADDPVVAGAVEAIGGPPGRHALVGERRFWTPVRVLLALTLLTCVFGWLQKEPCRDGSSWVHEHQYTRACYTDVVALYSAEGLSDGKTPYYDHPVEYPVVLGGVMHVTARVADFLTGEHHGQNASYRDSIDRGKRFFDLTWLLLTVCALVGVVTTARLAGRRPWDAAMFALAPALVIHGTTNWDLLAVALSGMALCAWAARRPVATGVLLGLATATKLYPVLFLVPLVMLCWRARRMAPALSAAVATLLTAGAVTLPVYLTAPSYADVDGTQTKVLDSPLSRLGDDGLSALDPTGCVVVTTSKPARVLGTGCGATASAGTTQQKATNAVYRFFDLNSTRPADWDSLYLQLQHLRTDHGALKSIRNGLADAVTDRGATPKRLNTMVALLELVVVAAVALLVVSAPRRPRLPQVLFLMVTGFLLVNKVDSPQYVLWLVPLAVLARPRWRPFLAWQAAEVLVLLSRFYFFVSNDKGGREGIDIGWFFAAVLLRDALLVGFALLVVRDVLHPELDVVRRDGVDDPAGGVLDGAPDARVAT